MNDILHSDLELDYAIADAVGWDGLFEAMDLQGKKFVSYVENGDGTYDAFRPSTDLNDSFYAANRAGLFDQKDGWLLYLAYEVGNVDEEWWVQVIIEDPEIYDCWRQPRGTEADHLFRCKGATTPALAICLAILELKQ